MNIERPTSNIEMKSIWLGAIIVWETLCYAVGAIFYDADPKRKTESGKQKKQP